MKNYTTVMQQVLSFLPESTLKKLTGQYQGDKHIRTFSTKNQLSVILYAQATDKESLRDIELALKMHQNLWHELGLISVAKSTVADACNRRNPKIFEGLFYALLQECQKYIPNRQFSFGKQLYSLDGSLISLCLVLFNWARYRKRKGACRMHTLFDNSKGIPTFLAITDGKEAEIKIAKNNWKSWNLPPESILAFDRGYIDYAWLYELTTGHIYFVTRAKISMQYVAIEERTITEASIIKDQIIVFITDKAEIDYPEKLRLVIFWDKEKKKEYRFLTNNFELSAAKIAEAYKHRWEIELFFKWIKQHLRIKTFFGTSENAVSSQIWIAMIYFLILAYIKAQTKIKNSPLELSRIFSEMFLERTPIINLFSQTPASIKHLKQNFNTSQQSIFDSQKSLKKF